MVEIIFEILGEFLLQALTEFLFERGLHSLAAPFRKRPNPIFAAISYPLFGVIAGGVSLLIFPEHRVVSA